RISTSSLFVHSSVLSKTLGFFSACSLLALVGLIALAVPARADDAGDASSRSGILPLRGLQSRAEPPKRLEAASTSQARAGTPARFDWNRDTFCFSNETLWAYEVDASGA